MTMSDKNEAYLSVLLEEFRWHYNECLKYIDSLNHFSNLQLVALGAAVAGLTALISQNDIQVSTIAFAILLVPIPFNFLAWSFEHCHMMIAANARYIAFNLRPKVEAATGRSELFEWEDFLQNDTFKFKDKYRFSSTVGYAGAFFLAVAITSLSVLVFAFLIALNYTNISALWWSIPIAVLDLLLLTLTVRNHLLVSKYFMSPLATPNAAVNTDLSHKAA